MVWLADGLTLNFCFFFHTKSRMKNALALLNRLLDALQGSQQGRRSVPLPRPFSPRPCCATAAGSGPPVPWVVRACAAELTGGSGVSVCRLLWFSFVVLVLLYWLSRRSARLQRPDRRTGTHVAQASPAAIALSPGFHRIPVQQKVSVMGNDSIFDSAELHAIDAFANSAAATSVPPALRLLPSGMRRSLTVLALK
jgi:hypothetical protein